MSVPKERTQGENKKTFSIIYVGVPYISTI